MQCSSWAVLRLRLQQQAKCPNASKNFLATTDFLAKKTQLANCCGNPTCLKPPIHDPKIRSGPGKPNQRKVSSRTFHRGIPEQKFNVNRACFPKEKHQNSHENGRNSYELFVLSLSVVWFAGTKKGRWTEGGGVRFWSRVEGLSEEVGERRSAYRPGGCLSGQRGGAGEFFFSSAGTD